MTTKVTNIYNLKLTPSQFGQSSLVVNCSQYDSLYRVIQFNLYNGNAVYSIPEGSVVTIRGTKKDNTGFEYECDYSNNVVTFPLQQQITIFPGKVPAELRITSNGEIIGSWNFLFLVEESPLSDNTIISETDLPLLESAIQAASEAENYKNLAQASADNASESEQNASESEANALTYSQNAQTSANSASQSEANALTYSQNASESATEAQGYAQDASDTAQGVTESVNLAQTYAQNASQSASEAENAKNLANQAISNISTFNTTTYPNAVQSIQNEGATQVANVTNEGTTQRGLVSSEGATQIANVQAEGTTQVGNVQAKGIEVLDSIPSDYTELSGEVEGLKNAFEQLEETTTVINVGNNLFDPTKKSAEDKVINWTNGEITNGTGYYVTDYIPVRKDVKYGYTGYGSFFAFYDSQKTFVSETETNDIKELDGGESTTTLYAVPVTWFKSPIDGYLRVSIPKWIINNNRGVFTPIKTSADIVGTDFPAYTDGNDLKNSAFEEIEKTNSNLDNLSANIRGQKNALVYRFNLSASSTYVQTVYVEDMCNYRLCFFGKLSDSFSGVLVVGKGANLDMGGSIRIDSTNVYFYFGGSNEPARTQAHGIEQFKDYIGISIDLGYTPEAKVYIYTNGDSYKWELPFFRSWRGTLTVYSSATAFTDCTLSYACAGLMQDTWLYGDSYFANSGNDRWTAYLVNNGYQNYALNAYPGRNSQEALRSLKTDLEIYKYPKRIIWCLGMNDPDTTEANSNWLAAVTELEEICQGHYIELILATIPLVPNASFNNSYKNAYVKNPNTGYRYIDFANAVNTGVGGNWYDGMINSDNVHPNQEGAIALYNQAIADVPELIQ